MNYKKKEMEIRQILEEIKRELAKLKKEVKKQEIIYYVIEDNIYDYKGANICKH